MKVTSIITDHQDKGKGEVVPLITIGEEAGNREELVLHKMGCIKECWAADCPRTAALFESFALIGGWLRMTKRSL